MDTGERGPAALAKCQYVLILKSTVPYFITVSDEEQRSEGSPASKPGSKQYPAREQLT